MTPPGAYCASSPRPAPCGAPCGDGATCAAGFYCGADGTCTADCVPTSGCSAGLRCTAAGRCVAIEDGAGGFDGARADGASASDGAVARDAIAPLGDSDVCAARSIDTARVTPNILLLIDRSGSMDDDFVDTRGTNSDEDSRWIVLRDFLLQQPSGLIASLQGNARFALALYDAPNSGCPRLVTVPPALNNFAAISTAYRANNPSGGTPTGESLTAMLARFQPQLMSTTDPTVIVLATDGEPDTCADGDDEVGGRRNSVEAARTAFQAGIKTYVISVGTNVSTAHLQEVANAGQGRTAAMPAQFYVTTNGAMLEAALREIIGAQVSCSIELMGQIDTADACQGTVRLGGRELTCNSPDGWRAVNGNTIELQGAACRQLQTAGERLEASFPCGVILL